MVTLESLYEDYCRELESFLDVPLDIDAVEVVSGYRKRRWNSIKLLFDEGMLAGFLIIGTAPNCHPDCEYFIAQAYVAPESRRKGIMTKAVSEFVKDHRGKYCMDILYKNYSARIFWLTRFRELGYELIQLPFMEHGVTGLCDTLYFEPASGAAGGV